MKGWHWVSDYRTLRDGRPLPAVGETLVHDGEVEMCISGLHASWTPLQALKYAPGSILCEVECRDIVDRDPGDKFVCRERTVLWSVDAADTLRRFARLCALDVIHLWDAPDVVADWLRTGDEDLLSAARSAADSAADWASYSAVYSASYSASSSAVYSASYSAAEWAARWAARSAADSEADWAADSEADWASYSEADWASYSAARESAYSVDRTRQSRRLSAMIGKLRGEES